MIIDFFRPDKKKVIFSLILPTLHAVLIVFLAYMITVLWPSERIAIPGLNVKGFLFYPFWVLFWYPFSCSAITIKEKGFKMIKGDKTTSGLVIFGMVVNPFVFQLLFLTIVYVFLRIMVLRGF